MIPDSVIEEIKYRCPIEDVISRYVNLKRAGSNMNGLCPFHSEKTPSFTVFRDTRSFYCFGCGAGGDVISFVMRAENLEYREAVELLAKQAGITIPEDRDRRREEGVSKARVMEMNRVAARFFFEELKKSERAQEYLRKRALSPALVKHFGIGYAPDSFGALTDHMHRAGFTDDELVAGFLCGKSRKTGRGFDYFRDRLMFPIIDTSGNVIAFGGRLIGDGSPKYLNSSDTPAFRKNRNLFALNFAKSACREQLILCEGYMDVVALHGAGFTNAVATLGTSLTEEQARIMKRCTDEVVISYDSDEAGQRAADRAFGLLREAGVQARVLKMDGAKDPDEYIKTYGAPKFSKLLENPYTEFDYKFANIVKKYDITRLEELVKASDEVAKVISRIYSSVERELYTKKAAMALNISSESLKRDVEKAVRQRVGQAKRDELREIKRSAEGLGDRVNPDRIKNLGGTAAEEALIGILLCEPEFIAKCRSGKTGLTPDDFVTELDRRVYEAMISCEGEFDIGTLNEGFAPDEVARVVGMQVKRRDLANTEQALADCIAALKKSKNEKNISLEDIIKKKRKANNNG